MASYYSVVLLSVNVHYGPRKILIKFHKCMLLRFSADNLSKAMTKF